MSSMAGASYGVHVVTQDEIDRGMFRVAPGPAVRVSGFVPGTRSVLGGAATPVYIVNDIAARGVQAGPAIPVVDMTGIRVATRGLAIPVYIESGEELGVPTPSLPVPESLNAWKTSGYTILDFCGQQSTTAGFAKMFNGILTDQWQHLIDHLHWFNIDLGERYLVSRIRRYKTASSATHNWINARLYVSDDPENWGDPAMTFTVAATADSWSEHELPESKAGRYVRVECEDTAFSDNWIAGSEFQVMV